MVQVTSIALANCGHTLWGLLFRVVELFRLGG